MVLLVNQLSGFGGAVGPGFALKNTTTASSTLSSITATIPSGAVDGDILALFVAHGDSSPLNPPSGWTALQTDTTGGFSMALHAKIYTSGDVNPTVSTGSGGNSTAICALIGGQDAGTLSSVTDSNESFIDAANDTTITSATISWGSSDETLILYFACSESSSVSTTPASFTTVATATVVGPVLSVLGTRRGYFSTGLSLGTWTFSSSADCGSISLQIQGPS